MIIKRLFAVLFAVAAESDNYFVAPVMSRGCLITKGILESLHHEESYSVFLYEQLRIHFRKDYSR